MKKSFFLPVILLAMAIGFASFTRAAKAATYYVSPSGSDSGSGSQSSPFQTIQHAVNNVSSGDTVMVEDGTYPAFEIGTSSITVKSQNKWGAVISAGGASFGILIDSGTSNVNIENFKVQNAYYIGIYGQAGCSGIYIYNNNVSNIGTQGTGGNGAAGIDFNGNESNITMDSNVVYNVGGGADDHSQDHGLDFEYGTLSNITIINNVCYNNDYGWDVQLYSGSVTNLYIIGNTFASTNPGNTGQIGLYMSMSNALVEDNIFYEPGGGAASYPAGKSFTANYNLTTASSMGADASGAGNILNAYPSLLFANPAAFDFSLQPSSPAIAAGVAWPGRTYDADGNPLGSPIDIGAYKFSTSTASTSSSSGTSTSTTTVPATSTTSTSGTTSANTTTNTMPTSATTSSGAAASGTGNTSTAATSPASTTTSSTASGSASASTSKQITAPQLLTPSQGQTVSTTVTLQWSPAKDPAPCTYTLYISQTQDFSGAAPIQVASAQNKMYAMGGGAAALLLFGLIIPGGIRPRRKLIMLLMAGVMAAGLLVSCGGGGSGSSQTSSSSPASSVSPSTSAVNYTVSGLSSNTTYYWKVVAQDNAGNTVQSQTGSFQTN